MTWSLASTISFVSHCKSCAKHACNLNNWLKKTTTTINESFHLSMESILFTELGENKFLPSKSYHTYWFIKMPNFSNATHCHSIHTHTHTHTHTKQLEETGSMNNFWQNLLSLSIQTTKKEGNQNLSKRVPLCNWLMRKTLFSCRTPHLLELCLSTRY